MFCAICRTAPGNATPIYFKLRNKNLPAREDQMFLTHTVNNMPEQCRLNVVAVQRAALHTLQLHIANLVSSIHKPGRGGGGCEDWKELSDHLHKYCVALRDLDYLLERAESRDETGSFCISSTRQIERDILEHAGLLPFHMDPTGPALPAPLDAGKPRLGWRPPAYAPAPRGDFAAAAQQQPPPLPPPPVAVAAPVPRTRSAAVPFTRPTSRLKRFCVAVAGALSLLIPVFIMVLIEGKFVDLITATVAILVVAVAMGLSSFELRTVLSITSGYAAVMIVFVGTRKIPYDEIGRS